MKILVKNPVWGVPITILEKFDDTKLKIVSIRKGSDGNDLTYTLAAHERERERVIYPYQRVLVKKMS